MVSTYSNQPEEEVEEEEVEEQEVEEAAVDEESVRSTDSEAASKQSSVSSASESESEKHRGSDDKARKLVRLIVKGDMKNLKKQVNEKNCDSVVDKDLNTLLIRAVGKDKAEAVQILLDAGADANLANSQGFTPLLVAARHGGSRATAITKLLLSYNADPFARCREARNGIYYAAISGNQILVTVLLKEMSRCDWQKLGLEQMRSQETKPQEAKHLHNYARDGIISKLTKLVNGTNSNCRFGPRYNTLLMTAVESDADFSLEIVRMLIRRGANAELGNVNGDTALHLAATLGKREMVRALIEQGRQLVHARNKLGETALFSACRSYLDRDVAKEIVSMLLAEGADPAACSDEGQQADDFALRGNHLEIHSLLSAFKGMSHTQQWVHNNTLSTDGWQQELSNNHAAASACSSSAQSSSSYDSAASLSGLSSASSGQANSDQRSDHSADSSADNASCASGSSAGSEDLEQMSDATEEGSELQAARRLWQYIEDGDYDSLETEADEVNSNLPIGRLGDTALTNAIWHSDAKAVQILMAAGANCRFIRMTGATPLLTACSNHKRPKAEDVAAVVRNLLKGSPRHRANPLSRNLHGNNALYKAKKNNLNEAAIELLTAMKRADWEKEAMDKMKKQTKERNKLAQQLHEWVSSGDVDQLQRKVTKGNCNCRFGEQADTLLIAAAKSKTQNAAAIIDCLLKVGADLEARNSLGNTALHCAASNTDAHSLRRLVRACLSSRIRARGLINARNSMGSTPLIYMMRFMRRGKRSPRSTAKLVNILLKANPKLTARSDSGKNAMHWAVASDVEAAVLTLAKAMKREDWARIAPKLMKEQKEKEKVAQQLHKYASNGDYTQLQKLVTKANCNCRSGDNADTLLMTAAMSASSSAGKIIQLLLRLGASVEDRNKLGYSPLHCAALKGSVGVVELLAKEGENMLEAVSCNGETPLLTATVNHGSEYPATEPDRVADVVQLLLQLGANPFARRDCGKDAVPLRYVEFKKAAMLLQQARMNKIHEQQQQQEQKQQQQQQQQQLQKPVEMSENAKYADSLLCVSSSRDTSCLHMESPFIQSVCNAVQASSSQLHLMEILKKVGAELKARPKQDENGNKLPRVSCKTSHSLTRLVAFDQKLLLS